MRIVGGTWRGRAIEAPQGRGTRPTTDRMRESLASMVLSARGLDVSDCAVLDAFAGSGGLGLELLSRGARYCTFCDKDRRAAAVVRHNCASLGVPKSAYCVLTCDVFRLSELVAAEGAPFDVVLLDPPYAFDTARIAEFVAAMDATGLLSADCLVVYERASTGDAIARSEVTTSSLAGFVHIKSKKHGGTTIDLLRRES